VIITIIECDGCKRERLGSYHNGQLQGRPHLIRYELHELGWRNVGRHDLCPRCLEKWTMDRTGIVPRKQKEAKS
jgi:hypothetical protein